MASECSQVDCLPPIPSGYYTIVNKVNGNINFPLLHPSDIPVVAEHVAIIWEIEHIKNHEYYILVHYTGSKPESVVDRNNLLYVVIDAQPDVWVICGEHDGTSREEIYIIKKKFEPIDPPPGPPLMTKAWALESPDPGTQVRVIPPPFIPGPGCEVNRVPKEFTWFIRRAPVPETAETQTA